MGPPTSVRGLTTDRYRYFTATGRLRAKRVGLDLKGSCGLDMLSGFSIASNMGVKLGKTLDAPLIADRVQELGSLAESKNRGPVMPILAIGQSRAWASMGSTSREYLLSSRMDLRRLINSRWGL